MPREGDREVYPVTAQRLHPPNLSSQPLRRRGTSTLPAEHQGPEVQMKAAPE